MPAAQRSCIEAVGADAGVGGLQWHFGRLTELWGLSQSIAVISAGEFSVMGRHLCSLAVPSVLCFGQGNIMQALFSAKQNKQTKKKKSLKISVAAKWVLLEASKFLESWEGTACHCSLPFCCQTSTYLTASAFPISSTKNTVTQGLESKSRNNLNPLTTMSFLTGSIVLKLVRCD